MQAMLAATGRRRQRVLAEQAIAIRAAVWAEAADFERFIGARDAAADRPIADADALLTAWGAQR